MTDQGKSPFIPGWLDELGLHASSFRLYCCLHRHADNKTGIAWPAIKRMKELTGFSKSTVDRCLTDLEERKLITKMGKPFGGSCRYLVASIVSPEVIMGGGNNVTRGHIEPAPIVSPEARNSPSDEPSIVSPEGKEGSPKKVLQEGSQKYVSELAESVWKETPAMGRERSSKKQLRAALKKLTRAELEMILPSLRKWKQSRSWMKDGGQYVEGIHRWVENRKWEDALVEIVPKLNLGGRRPAEIITIPHRPIDVGGREPSGIFTAHLDTEPGEPIQDEIPF